MKLQQAFTEKFHGANIGGPSKYQNIHDSFSVWLVHLSSIKFLTGYYPMSMLYHNMIYGYKYTEHNIITTQCNAIKLIE